jgi:SAM-dependent methyltransferase
MDPVHARPAEADERRYPAPVSARRAVAVAELLGVAPGGAVLDVGDGPAGLLLDAVGLTGCHGVGLVGTAAAADASRIAAEREGLAGRVEFSATPPSDYLPPRRFDAILCFGDLGRSAGALDEAAARCLGWLRLGGVFVYGEPFLRRPPPPVYRELLGAAGEGLPPPGASARAVVATGFELTLTAVFSETEWDAHESAAYRSRLRHAASAADRGAARELRERAERWYQAYWRHGRDTLGYALHAFRKPGRALHLV